MYHKSANWVRRSSVSDTESVISIEPDLLIFSFIKFLLPYTDEITSDITIDFWRDADFWREADEASATIF